MDGNRRGVRLRSDDEIVFESLLIAVIDQIHARIDFLDAHAVEGGNARVPPRRIVADEVIDLARQRFHSRDGRGHIGAHQTHADDGPGSGALGGALLSFA